MQSQQGQNQAPVQQNKLGGNIFGGQGQNQFLGQQGQGQFNGFQGQGIQQQQQQQQQQQNNLNNLNNVPVNNIAGNAQPLVGANAVNRNLPGQVKVYPFHPYRN